MTIIGRGSGAPVGIPDFRPQNPWGRPMPKPTRPYREKPIFHALYQVFAEDRVLKKHIPLGPKMAEECAGALAEAINMGITLGQWKTTGRAYLRQVRAEKVKDTRTIGELLLGDGNGSPRLISR